MATRRRTRRKPTWERAYRGHVLWLGEHPADGPKIVELATEQALARLS